MSGFLEAVGAETERARAKFPGARHQCVALVEEVGEVARALLDGEGSERIWAECVQVAAMAQRIAEEGDLDFGPARSEGDEKDG